MSVDGMGRKLFQSLIITVYEEPRFQFHSSVSGFVSLAARKTGWSSEIRRHTKTSPRRRRLARNTHASPRRTHHNQSPTRMR